MAKIVLAAEGRFVQGLSHHDARREQEPRAAAYGHEAILAAFLPRGKSQQSIADVDVRGVALRVAHRYRHRLSAGRRTRRHDEVHLRDAYKVIRNTYKRGLSLYAVDENSYIGERLGQLGNRDLCRSGRRGAGRDRG